MPTGNTTLDSVAVGRRFACCRNVYPSREDLEKVEWQTGIIRAATENEINHDDQQFCVEWDGKDPVRDYQWIYLHDTLEEDRFDNVEGGDFGIFLIEDKIMWCDVEGLPNGNGVKSNKQHSHKNFRPVSTFIPLLDHMGVESRSRVPVYLLAENRLVFVDKDQTNNYPVQQHQTSLTIKGLSIPVQKDHQIAINHWFDTRRTQQRLIVDKDKHLIGQSVQVYWKDGANQRWYAACLKGFNHKDNSVTVMDYNVIQDRKVDPRLEEIRIVKDQGRSAASTASTSPIPVESVDAARRSRRASNAKPTTPAEESKPVKAAGKKRGPKKTDTPTTEKRPRGRPAKSSSPIKPKKREPTPVSDSEEDLPLKQSADYSDSDNDEEPSWSLSKLTAKHQKAVSPVPPVKRKKAPALKSPLPMKKRFQLKKDVDEDEEDYSEASDVESEASEVNSEGSFVTAPKKKSATKKKSKTKELPIKKAPRGRKSTKVKEGSEERQLPVRTKKQPVSYRETSDEESDEKAKVFEAGLPAAQEPPPPFPASAERSTKDKKVKKERAPSKKRKGVASPVIPKEDELPQKSSLDFAETKNEPVAEKDSMRKSKAKSIDRSPPPPVKNSLIAALTAPVAVLSANAAATTWPNVPITNANSKQHMPATTVAEIGATKKMARVAGQPQGPPSDTYAREPVDNHRRPEQFAVHNNARTADRPVAGSTNAVAPPPNQVHSTQSPALPPPATQSSNPADFFHQQQMRYNQQHPTANQSYVPPPYQPYVQQGMPPASQAAHAQPRQAQQQNAMSSVFRATTPSPFVPRNSPVSNPQQQQQQPQQQQPQQQGQNQQQSAQPVASQAQNTYRPTTSSAPYQTQQHPQQTYPAGAMMTPYGQAFYYQNAMGAAAQGFGGAPGALVYGSANSQGVMPMYLTAQGGQWDPSMLYNAMMPGLQHGQMTNEQYVRMAAAAAAANNRAAVRSTATSPDLRQHSTGVIAGAMQALNNLQQLPSPPLINTGLPFMTNTKHMSSSPVPNIASAKNYAESLSAPRDRPSSSQSHSSHLSSTSRSSPHVPPRHDANDDSSRTSKVPIKEPHGAAKDSTRAKPDKEPSKRSRKKADPAPKMTIAQVQMQQAQAAQQQMHAQQMHAQQMHQQMQMKPQNIGTDQSRAQANEPCPLAMLSSIATSMRPVDTAKSSPKPVDPSPAAVKITQKATTVEQIAPTVFATTVVEKTGVVELEQPVQKMVEPEEAVSPRDGSDLAPVNDESSLLSELRSTVVETLPEKKSPPPNPEENDEAPLSSPTSEVAAGAEMSNKTAPNCSEQPVVDLPLSEKAASPSALPEVAEEEPKLIPSAEEKSADKPSQSSAIVSYPNSDEEDEGPRLRIADEPIVGNGAERTSTEPS